MASAFTVARVPKWKISDDHEVTFTSGHPDGVFKGLQGEVAFDEKD